MASSRLGFMCFFLLGSLSLCFGYHDDERYPFFPGGGGGGSGGGYPYSPGGGSGGGGGGGGGEKPYSPPQSPSGGGGGGGEKPYGPPQSPSGGGGGGGEKPYSPPHTPSGGGGGGKKDKEMFLLKGTRQVLKGEAGEFRVVRGFEERGMEQPPMHIGFINMEPQSLFVPQYLDSNLILFVSKGSAKIGWINNTKLVETNVKAGDVFRIPAGSTFYIVNTGEGQILRMICSIDTTDSLGMGAFQSFFIAGGLNPRSIFTGFEQKTISTALNVSSAQLEDLFKKQLQGPVIFVHNTTNTSSWDSILQLKHKASRVEMEDEDEDVQDSWIWRKLMNFVASADNKKKKSTESKSSSGTYNIFKRKPDFKNDYGSTKAITQEDYAPLGESGKHGVGVYLVSLNASGMLAPHVNPSATEFGIVLYGSGSVQIVYPNGTTAMNAVVHEGDVFWVPRYFPFCHIASRNGPFVFFGFTTNAFVNNPQFLAGASSILKTINGPELAMSFGVDQKTLDEFIDAQSDSIIMSSASAAPPQGGGGKGGSGEHGKGEGGHSHEDLKIELWTA